MLLTITPREIANLAAAARFQIIIGRQYNALWENLYALMVRALKFRLSTTGYMASRGRAHAKGGGIHPFTYETAMLPPGFN